MLNKDKKNSFDERNNGWWRKEKNLKTFYEIEQGESAAASKRRSIERAIEFIKRVKRETLLLLPEVLEKIKVDVDATAAQKDSGDNALLGEEDVQEFDNLVARIKSAS